MAFISDLGYRIGKALRGLSRKDQAAPKAVPNGIRTENLQNRFETIVQIHLSKLRPGYEGRYYIENAVRDCVQYIAEAAGQSSVAPNNAYLSAWLRGAPPEYRELAESLLERFRAHQKQLSDTEKELRRQSVEGQFEALKAKYSDLIAQFYEITERKVSVLDDYGDENWDVLPKEVDIVIQKIAKREVQSDRNIKYWKKYHVSLPEPFRQLMAFLTDSFKDYHSQERTKSPGKVDFSRMTGSDFEIFLANILKQNGFLEVRGTPTTGDQGADLIAKKNGRTIVIQAKRYDSPVGNKAVQEVASAVSFYGVDEGWVVTNSTFTKSARELAQRTGIRLIDGRDLTRFSNLPD